MNIVILFWFLLITSLFGYLYSNILNNTFGNKTKLRSYLKSAKKNFPPNQ